MYDLQKLTSLSLFKVVNIQKNTTYKNPGALKSHISWVYLLSWDEHCTTVQLTVSFPSLGKL